MSRDPDLQRTFREIFERQFSADEIAAFTARFDDRDVEHFPEDLLVDGLHVPMDHSRSEICEHYAAYESGQDVPWALFRIRPDAHDLERYDPTEGRYRPAVPRCWDFVDPFSSSSMGTRRVAPDEARALAGTLVAPERPPAEETIATAFDLDVGSTTAGPPDRGRLREAAYAGDVDAALTLGWLAADDPASSRDARVWLRRAAEAGRPEAAFRLARLHLDLSPADRLGARHWMQHAANGGDSRGMTALGLSLVHELDPPNVRDGIYWLRRAACMGNTDACHLLADVLIDELDPPDPEQAERWYRRAARADHPEAAFALGALLQEQEPPDLAGAQHWYRIAADAGDLRAMTNLGLLLTFDAERPDPDAGEQWLRRAAAGGDLVAMEQLGLI